MIHHTHTDTCRQTKTECLQQLLTGKGIKNLGPPESNSLSKNLFNITNTTHKTFCSKNEPVLQQIFDERRQVKMPQKNIILSQNMSQCDRNLLKRHSPLVSPQTTYCAGLALCR